jgi:hypothetical protein
MGALMKHLWMILALFVGILVVGCSQNNNQALPTVMPTAASGDAATATAPATSAPTQVPLDRPTLPPTWTVSPVPTQAPTATIDAAAQADLVKPTLVVCGVFGVDRERSASTFTVGSPVVVFWTAVDTAARYRIGLFNENGEEIFMDYTREPTYTFRTDLFEKGKRYSWSVYPEDAINQQMCFERGGDILHS